MYTAVLISVGLLFFGVDSLGLLFCLFVVDFSSFVEVMMALGVGVGVVVVVVASAAAAAVDDDDDALVVVVVADIVVDEFVVVDVVVVVVDVVVVVAAPAMIPGSE